MTEEPAKRILIKLSGESLMGKQKYCIELSTVKNLSINIESIRDFITILFGQELFSPQVYFLSKLPSNINFNEVLVVMLLSISLTLLASMFPAWKASKISPAEALRYE